MLPYNYLCVVSTPLNLFIQFRNSSHFLKLIRVEL